MTDVEALERDLMMLVDRHNTITGRQFQAAALHVAGGYYDADDLDEYHRPDDLAQALAQALARALDVAP